MFNKKNYVLNCDVCDTRNMKEEDYKEYEKMIINTDVVIVSPSSKSILNRLPAILNQDCTIELPENLDVTLKTINGSYEITSAIPVQEHTLLIVNGDLKIHPGTEASLEKYERIHVNGSVRCPQSLESYLPRLSSNGSVSIFPDDCVILEDTFIVDKYFPLRAKEGKKYFVKDRVIMPDPSTDMNKLAQKQVQFITGQLIVPEDMVEACIALFDETVAFAVTPAKMALHYGDAVLNDQLTEKEGRNIYVYGNLNIPENAELEALAHSIGRLVVKGNVRLRKDQAEDFKKINAEYNELEFKWEGRIIENKPSARVDNTLLENSPNRVLIRNTAITKIASDVPPAAILDRLMIENCAKVSCSEEQESAIAAVATNVGKIGNGEDDGLPSLSSGLKELLSTKVINADSYIM